MNYFIAYDICDDKRRRKLHKYLKQYGLNVQKSIFQCVVTKEVLENLIFKMRKFMDERVDKLYVYPVCDRCLSKAFADGTGVFDKIELFTIL
ncbi:MAG: CRISPR-associated endonuclease Cas2 [Exilispira sp.]